MNKLFENWRRYLNEDEVGAKAEEIRIPGTEEGILYIPKAIPQKERKNIIKTVFKGFEDIRKAYQTGGPNSIILMDMLLRISGDKEIKLYPVEGPAVAAGDRISILVNEKNVKQVYNKYLKPVILNAINRLVSVNILISVDGQAGGAAILECTDIEINYPFYSYDGLYANLMHEIEHSITECALAGQGTTKTWNLVTDDQLDLFAKILQIRRDELSGSQQTHVGSNIDVTHSPYFKNTNEIRSRLKTVQYLLRQSSGDLKRIFMPEDIKIVCEMLPQQERGSSGSITGVGHEPIVNKIGDITPEIAYILRPHINCNKAQEWAEYLNKVAAAKTTKASMTAE